MSTEQDTTGQDQEPRDENAQDALQQEIGELRERLARVTADFQNSRKRLEADAEVRMQYANGELIKSLLPALDNFERAIAVDPAKTDAPTLIKGLQIVKDLFLAALKAQQVEVIFPEPGTPFDPALHEAVMQQESEHVEPTVLQCFGRGYLYKGRRLRPAQVVVSKPQGA